MILKFSRLLLSNDKSNFKYYIILLFIYILFSFARCNKHTKHVAFEILFDNCFVMLSSTQESIELKLVSFFSIFLLPFFLSLIPLTLLSLSLF